MELPKISDLSVQEKIGQIFCSYFTENDMDQAHTLVKEYKVGSLHVGYTEKHSLSQSLCELLRGAKIPFLVCANLEGGFEPEVAGLTSFPSAMALAAATDSVNFAYQVGLARGMEARYYGITWLFLPVADVNTSPLNPIINTRSFGDDVSRVSELAMTYALGIANAGVLATAKHFPGHGSTVQDSHVTCVSCTNTGQKFRDIDLAPFACLIDNCIPTIMTAHMKVPHLDAEMATFSRVLLQDVLRNELKFKGVVISDAMFMHAVTETYPPLEAAQRALMAGCDVLLTNSEDTIALIPPLTEMVENGSIPMSRLDEAVSRVLAAKENVFNYGLELKIDEAEHRLLAKEVASKSITLLSNENGLLPLTPEKVAGGITLVTFGKTRSYDEIFFDLLENVAVRWGVLCMRRDFLVDEIDTRHTVIIGLYSLVHFWSNKLSLSRDWIQNVQRFIARHQAVVVIFGNPYIAKEFQKIPTGVIAYDALPMTSQAVVEALCGEIPFSGKLPLTLV